MFTFEIRGSSPGTTPGSEKALAPRSDRPGGTGDTRSGDGMFSAVGTHNDCMRLCLSLQVQPVSHRSVIMSSDSMDMHSRLNVSHAFPFLFLVMLGPSVPLFLPFSALIHVVPGPVVLGSSWSHRSLTPRPSPGHSSTETLASRKCTPALIVTNI